MIKENWDCIVNFPIKRKEKKLPKSWEEFCEMFPVKKGECEINFLSEILQEEEDLQFRNPVTQKKVLPNLATVEAVLALCQLIQLRNCYNGDWVPDWLDNYQTKYVIYFKKKCITSADMTIYCEILYFKTTELRDKFLENFRPLIEKLKPLYGIKDKKGGEE